MIVLRNLRKVYPGGKVAVRDATFGIPRGECFGFLGINGAGKTTTLKILSGDIIPTSGTATLGTLDVLKKQIEVRRLLGYCPQFEALFELLTTREHLELYARIKGVPTAFIEPCVQQKLQEMDLKRFENKTAGSLSGGNKRKLSVAISLIGDPPICFLDEPSTGMDPVARRFMWNVIARIATQNKQCSIMLTTHSMEECEALCGRLGIMVGGRLRCLGSPQHLKNRFGQGYLLEVKLAAPAVESIAAVVEAMAHHVLKDRVPANAVQPACSTLRNPGRYQLINPSGSGWALHGHIVSTGSVDASELAEWWLVEDGMDALSAFVLHTFAGAVLVERHGLHARFKLPPVDSMPLSRMFSVFEEQKPILRILEYALSQTSLEQIFNSFAALQEEETGKVRGVN